MKVWVLEGSYEAEIFTAVHMTEKGCALACICDVLEFLGVEDEETALEVMNSNYSYPETVPRQETVALEWDFLKMKKMSRKELWDIFRNWCEVAWEHMADRNYQIGAVTKMLEV